MPVFVPKGDTLEERRLDTKRFMISVVITYSLLLGAPLTLMLIESFWPMGYRLNTFTSMYLGCFWCLFAFMNGPLVSDLYVIRKSRKLTVRDWFSFLALNVAIALGSLVLASALLKWLSWRTVS
jgi:hypothetical protein